MEPRPHSRSSLMGLLGLPRGAGGLDFRERDELFAMWTAARTEANLAYDAWRQAPGASTYWTYRAAEERADAAQDALAEACRRYPRPDAFRAAA